MLKSILYFIFLICVASTHAQILDVSPSFPTRTGTITITYDATQGNGTLTGISPVYAHTGLVTKASISTTDWKKTQGNWGTADAKVLTTNLGGNKFSISFNIDAFYGATTTDTILYLAFVFRNTDGSKVGRQTDGTDILLPIYDDKFHAGFVKPAEKVLAQNVNTTINLLARANKPSQMSLKVNGNLLATGSGDSLYYANYTFLNYGIYTFGFEAISGTDTVTDSRLVYINPIKASQNPPSGTFQGINYIDDSTVVLSLLAPFKNFVYVIGDFNNWQIDHAYYMNRAPDGETYWLKIQHLVPGKEYIFQYLVDGDIRIGDPYSDKISDPNVDKDIPQKVYPDLIAYPYGKTQGIASVLQTARTAYPWKVNNFQKPEKSKLVIYEMLVRDFVTTGSYDQIIDSLHYLVNLGVNAIQLMPIMNFEGSSSWGYNPNYFCAPNKVYGTRESFRKFVDTCHSLGIAVLLDIALNHAFSTNPMVMMYWDSINKQPAANSPWFNQKPKHPFNVGYDFNHESSYTTSFVHRVNRTWIRDYHVDGFRFDLTKGLTQKYTDGDVGAWGQYDASRIQILKKMVDSIWAFDPTSICVFEHLSDNAEEIELANHGILLWGNLTDPYGQSTMGYSTGWDFSWGSYQSRGWGQPNLVTYMESHDEERLMYRNLQYGYVGAGYNVKSLDTALRRMELAGTLFFTIPGPKMIWQFGELGYDVSINNGCRVCNKPILWSYAKKQNRLHLYKVWSALIKLRTTYPTFQTSNYNIYFYGSIKSIRLNHNDFNAIAIGNFDVVQLSATPNFQHSGWWYDYFTGDSLQVTNTNQSFNYKAGEYHIYTDKRLPLPDLTTSISTGLEDMCCEIDAPVKLYPNPTQDRIALSFELSQNGPVRVDVYDVSGRQVLMKNYNLRAGEQQLELSLNEMNQTSSRMYFINMLYGDKKYTGKVFLTR